MELFIWMRFLVLVVYFKENTATGGNERNITALPLFTLNNSSISIQNFDNGPRIVGGIEANTNDAKYQVSIRLRASDVRFGEGHICGGSLINNNTVLTAAHCLFESTNSGSAMRVRRASEFTVVAGTLNRYERSANAMEFKVTQLKYHSRYSAATLENDIAILFLDKEVPATHPTIQPIDVVNYEMPTAVTCQISGWGVRYSNGPNVQGELLKADIVILPKSSCSAYNTYFRNGMLCAGAQFGGKDACQGDSGGPLKCNNVLVGVVSWGNDCGLAQFPGIYSDVYYYRSWITANSRAHSSQFTQINFSFLIFSAILCFAINRRK